MLSDWLPRLESTTAKTQQTLASTGVLDTLLSESLDMKAKRLTPHLRLAASQTHAPVAAKKLSPLEIDKAFLGTDDDVRAQRDLLTCAQWVERVEQLVDRVELGKRALAQKDKPARRKPKRAERELKTALETDDLSELLFR